MERTATKTVARAILYTETHLNEKLDLETVAKAVHYSKYHLHHMFTSAAGMTLHDYIRRRRLTEAARQLISSDLPVMDIALAAGYESQQAFSDVFKAMYKQTPGEYRERRRFYPLQLKLILIPRPTAPDAMTRRITYAAEEDIPAWMDFAFLVIGDFPCFQKEEHLESLKRHIRRKQAFLMRDQNLVVGAAAFTPKTGSIDFLGVHPQYRRHGVTKAFLDLFSGDEEISITTFRAGDRADTGCCREYLKLGFSEAELLTEYGYPTQKLVLPPGRRIRKGGTLI